ncbi:MAG: hypothetical protein HAW61_01965 [Candidatus Portiera sp.]|nr:hypothetical protein [Portiera sp.]
MKAIILLSLARHPLSGKIICSPNDLRALSMMSSMMGSTVDAELKESSDGASNGASNGASFELKAVHAGDPNESVMNEYLGYGLPAVDVIKTKKNEDPCPKLAKYLQQEKPQLVVAGMQALGGWGSGLVPYILAEQINYPLISGTISVALQDGQYNNDEQLLCSQYLPKGRRRDFIVAPPLFITVHLRAPNKPQFVWAQQQQGEIQKVAANANANNNVKYKKYNKSDKSSIQLTDNWDLAPADKKRSRLSIRSNRSGFERMQRAVSLSGGGGNIVKDGSVLEKAQITYNMIKQNDVYSEKK